MPDGRAHTPTRAPTPVRLAVPAARVAWAVLAGLVIAPAAAPLAAQDPDGRQDQDRLTVTGVVTDAVTATPLRGAVVWLEPGRRSTMTDEAGRFVFKKVPGGHVQLFVEQLGYANFTLTQLLEAESPPIEVAMAPVPVVLEGLHVMADRLRARRLSTGVSVRTLDAEYLSRRAGDLLQAIRYGRGVVVAGCQRRHLGSRVCVYRRGQFIEPVLYIDDIPAVGGLDQLTLYNPTEVYAVEIYSAGAHIRVYTRHYMARMAMNPRPLHPLF